MLMVKKAPCRRQSGCKVTSAHHGRQHRHDLQWCCHSVSPWPVMLLLHPQGWTTRTHTGVCAAKTSCVHVICDDAEGRICARFKSMLHARVMRRFVDFLQVANYSHELLPAVTSDTMIWMSAGMALKPQGSACTCKNNNKKTSTHTLNRYH